MSEYHSQHGEDFWIEQNLNLSMRGIFCEIGAFDGILSSNTLFLERKGWHGILVEADPYLVAKCQFNRKSPTFCCAVDSKGGIGEFHINSTDRGLSGFTRPGEPVSVLKMRLDLILALSKINELDFLSIDTEGTELDVWDSIGDIRPRIVIMEYRTCDEPPNDAAIVERMTTDGYREVHRTACNLIFTR